MKLGINATIFLSYIGYRRMLSKGIPTSELGWNLSKM